MRQGVLSDAFRLYVPADSVEEQWDVAGLEQALAAEFQLRMPVAEWIRGEPNLDDEEILRRIVTAAEEVFAAKTALVDVKAWHQFERNVMLQSLDTHWREHLAALDHLRQGIHLRGYAQKNPKQEYKREAFELFETLLDAVRSDVTKLLMTVQVRTEAQLEEVEAPAEMENVQYHHADYAEALGAGGAEQALAEPRVNAAPKVGRNDACPCGSGKKYKHCHGKLN
jgi:preprotein translocase subunit SecA